MKRKEGTKKEHDVAPAGTGSRKKLMGGKRRRRMYETKGEKQETKPTLFSFVSLHSSYNAQIVSFLPIYMLPHSETSRHTSTFISITIHIYVRFCQVTRTKTRGKRRNHNYFPIILTKRKIR